MAKDPRNEREVGAVASLPITPSVNVAGARRAVDADRDGTEDGAARWAEPAERGAGRGSPGPRHEDRRHEALVAAAREGDRSAFRQLFARHHAEVTRLAYRMLGPKTDLEDVVQEVFVQVHRSLKDFRGQSKFSTWLHRVTVNVVLMHRRAARSRPVLTEEITSDAVSDREPLPDDVAERSERMRAFERLLARLADKKRVVFVLHDLEGMSPAAIGEIVDAPVLTVRTRLFYARRELAAMMSEEPALAGLLREPDKDEGEGA